MFYHFKFLRFNVDSINALKFYTISFLAVVIFGACEAKSGQTDLDITHISATPIVDYNSITPRNYRWFVFRNRWGFRKGGHGFEPDLRKFARPEGIIRIITKSLDQKYVIGGSTRGGFVWVWDAETYELISATQIKPKLAPIGSIILSPDSKFFAVTNLGSAVHVFDMKTGKLKYKVAGKSWLEIFGISPDSKLIVVSHRFRNAQIRSASDGKLITELEDSGVIAGSGNFSTDGRLYIERQRLDRRGDIIVIRIWDVSTGKLLRTVPVN